MSLIGVILTGVGSSHDERGIAIRRLIGALEEHTGRLIVDIDIRVDRQCREQDALLVNDGFTIYRGIGGWSKGRKDCC